MIRRLTKSEIEALAGYHEFQESCADSMGVGGSAEHHKAEAAQLRPLEDRADVLLVALEPAERDLLRKCRQMAHCTALACWPGLVRSEEEAKVTLLDRLLGGLLGGPDEAYRGEGMPPSIFTTPTWIPGQSNAYGCTCESNPGGCLAHRGR